MKNKVAITLIAAAAILTSCAGPSSERSAAPLGGDGTTATTTAGAPADPGGRWLGGDADGDWSGGEGSGGHAAGGAATEAYAAEDAASLRSTARPAAGSPVPPTTLMPGDVIAPPQRSGPGLRAGSVDDNAAFADYLKYRDEFRRLGITVHDIDVSIRHVVTVVDEAGQPLLGATVTAGDQEVRTGAGGRALLFGTIGGVRAPW